ncbi:O-antigen/teichoic acid export membrane protein [Anoxybacillus vitaminiphilus]|uniref:O-antigen/teichoic acid export membrane protein n=1 Tax=Paranoxybacillus vitaminiphilus TaxID=581036 RepID=A0A327YJC4_9BACL|nr:flippase [Anoxybacillus vitaminiphilus]RAK20397.1 O-antigen/teichoic acid export membrane protein [Anoxybacillus vitaminiphilus]
MFSARKLSPKFIFESLKEKADIKKIVSNAGWLFIDRIFRMGVGLLVGLWIARYLGPEQYGLLNYAQAFIALFSAFATLGLDGIVIRNLLNEPDKKEELLGTAFALKFIGGLLVFILSVTLTIIIGDFSENYLRIWLIFFVSLGVVFQSFDVIDFWFQSQIQSKYTVIAKGLSFTIISLFKVVLILFKANLMAFAIAGLLEVLLGALFLIAAFKIKGNSISRWKFKKSVAISLLKDSWPLILSGLAVTLYMRIDQVMIGNMLGDRENGLYTAAVKLVEMWYFIPTSIVASTFPVIIKLRKQNLSLYLKRLQQLYNLMTWLGILIAVVITIFSKQIILLLYGEGYSKSSFVLSISVWAGIFVFQGVARGNWIQAENLQRYSYWYTLIGCIVNIVLNLITIPKYGIYGAAVSTLISQFVVAIVAPSFFKETRLSSKMILKSFLWGK